MSSRYYRAFTITELMIALLILMMSLGVLAEASVWHARERTHAWNQEEALETAANVIERASATPFTDLTPAWAAQQKLPGHLTLPSPRLEVSVEAATPGLKKVSVEVLWQGIGKRERSVALTRLLAARSSKEANR